MRYLATKAVDVKNKKHAVFARKSLLYLGCPERTEVIVDAGEQSWDLLWIS